MQKCYFVSKESCRLQVPTRFKNKKNGQGQQCNSPMIAPSNKE